MKPFVRVALISLISSLAFAGPKIASDMPQSTPSGMVDASRPVVTESVSVEKFSEEIS